MSGNTEIATITLVVDIQENGIIRRHSDDFLIGCLTTTNPFDSLANAPALPQEPNTFPIQAGIKYDEPQTEIPLWLAEIAYEYYAERFGTSQSLKRLGERGGFGRDELLMLLRREKL